MFPIVILLKSLLVVREAITVIQEVLVLYG